MSGRLLLAGVLLIAAGLLCWATGLDLALHEMLRLPAASPWRGPLALLTHLGGLAAMGPIALAVMLVLILRGRRPAALWLFATIASGRLAVEGIKLVATRVRPPRADWLVSVDSWSFPSSHSAGTMLTGLALALLIGTRTAYGIALAFTLLIGWTRVALGVHWPGDVLAGWGFALVWVGVATRWSPPSPSFPRRRESTGR